MASTPRRWSRTSACKLLSFTGGQIGWDLKARAGRKKVTLELGGNAACIVDADQGARLDRVVERLVFGAFYQSGQSCIGVQRIYAHADIYDALKKKLVAATRKLKAGDPKQQGHLPRPDDRRGRRRAPARLDRRGEEGRRQDPLRRQARRQHARGHADGKRAGRRQGQPRGSVRPVRPARPVQDLRRGRGDGQRLRLRPAGRHLHRQPRRTPCAHGTNSNRAA